MDSHMWDTAQKFTAVIAVVIFAMGMETRPVKENWQLSYLCQYLAMCDHAGKASWTFPEPSWPRQSRPNLEERKAETSKKWATNFVFWSMLIDDGHNLQ